MERGVKHWYYSEWKDGEQTAVDSGASPWRIQPPADDCHSQDTWTRRQTTLTTFGDGASTTPRRTATVRDEAQVTSMRVDGRTSSSDRWNGVSSSSSDGCFVVGLNAGQSGDVATDSDQCRCATRALLVIDDDDDDTDDVCDSGATSKNCGTTAPAVQRPCPPAAPRSRGCTDCTEASKSSLSRKPKMVVKPNCDQATASYCDTTSGRRLAKHDAASLERGANNTIDVDCGTGVPDITRLPDNVLSATSNISRSDTLQSRGFCSVSEQSTSSQKASDSSDSKTSYAPRLFFADAGGGLKAHGNAAVYRTGSYHNGIVGESENSAINRSSLASQASYGCTRNQIFTSGLAPSGDVQVISSTKLRRRYCACLSSTDGCVCRLVVSTITSFVAGCLAFFAARYQLRSSLPVTVGVSVSATSAMLVALLLSRRCRCVVALMLPSVSTDRGRAGCVLLTVAALMCGPAVNIEFNVREMARSMTCSADVAYNQTLLLLQVSFMTHASQFSTILNQYTGQQVAQNWPCQRGS